MVTIRLARFGTKNAAKYRVTVADHRRAAKKKYLEIVGHYNPHPRGKEQSLTLDMDRVKYWISVGAQPTPRVKSLMRKLGSN